MKGTADGYSKKWIYFPLYVVALVGSVWLFYKYLNPIKATDFVEQKKDIEEKIPETFLTCFNDHKHYIGGTVSLAPTSILMKTFEEMDAKCYDIICNELEDLKTGSVSVKDIYSKANDGDICLMPFINFSKMYHWQMLEKLPLMGLFFDSGTDALTSHQRKDLGNFLVEYGKISGKYGLLIIGRASKLGTDEANKSLSRLRSESIIEFVSKHYKNNIRPEFVYFGADPPQLTKLTADRLGIDKKLYQNVNYGSGNDEDFSLRLNQSVLLVIYDLESNPFDRNPLF